MKAADFDYVVDLEGLAGPLPDRYTDWPIGTDGAANRLQDADDGAVLLDVRVVNGLVHVEQMPIRDEDTGGLEGRFGDWQPADPNTGPMANYEQDTRDNLQNRPIGTNGPYEVHGNTVDGTDFSTGNWPASSDLTPLQVADWARARGDDHTAGIFDQLHSEMNG